MCLGLCVQEYIETGSMPETSNYDFSVEYDEFANPSVESKLPVLGSAWSNNQLSTKQYANLLWKDKLSEQELQEEIDADVQVEQDRAMAEEQKINAQQN